MDTVQIGIFYLFFELKLTLCVFDRIVAPINARIYQMLGLLMSDFFKFNFINIKLEGCTKEMPSRGSSSVINIH